MTVSRHQRGQPLPTLQAYLLGMVPFEQFCILQERLHHHFSEEPSQAALILCEHPPLVTVGRQGSRAHISLEEEDLRARRMSIRWVARGGGCLLHLPGQLAVYPILPLERFGLSVRAYLDKLNEVVLSLLADFSIFRAAHTSPRGVWIGSRPVACLGVAVRQGITGFGAYLNVDPDLLDYQRVSCTSAPEGYMTSLARERGGMVRMALVRQRLVEHFQAVFGFECVALFSDHRALHPQPRTGTLRQPPPISALSRL